MPRPRSRPPPPCPNPVCLSDLRKHDKVGGVQRYRCPTCHELLKPGKTIDWVAVSGEVLRGFSLAHLSNDLGTDEETASRMLAAWARRASGSRHAKQSIGVGKGWWRVSALGYTVAVGVQRGEAFRVVGWQGGPGLPVAGQTAKAIKPGAQVWVDTILAGAGGVASGEENRLWIALARTNAWPMD